MVDHVRVRTTVGISILCLSTFLAFTEARALDISTCAVEVPAGETGVLQADLDCSAFPGLCEECTQAGCGPGAQNCNDDLECAGVGTETCLFPAAVTLRNGATLDMNGHAIDGGDRRTVRCFDPGKRCTVLSSTGRGDITGRFCVLLATKTKLSISSVDIHDCGEGIVSNNISARVTATDVTVTDCEGHGIRSGRFTGTNVTATGNNRGITAEAGPLRGTNITVADNDSFGAISSKPFKLDGFVATNNGAATTEGSGAGLWAIRGGKMANSTLTGNVYQDASGPIEMDLLSTGVPRVTATTCGKSGGKGGSAFVGWGVCTND